MTDRGNNNSIACTFVVDTSFSMNGPRSAQVSRRVKRIFNSLSEGDCFHLITFSDRVDLGEGPQLLHKQSRKSQATLISNRIRQCDGNTCLYDACYESVRSVSNLHLSHEKSVLVILTDGEDDSSIITLEDAHEALNSLTETHIFIVGCHLNQKAQLKLKELAKNVTPHVYFSSDALVNEIPSFMNLSIPSKRRIMRRHSHLEYSSILNSSNHLHVDQSIPIESIQSLFDQCCIHKILGYGRDQKHKMKYNRLIVRKVIRLNNSILSKRYSLKLEELKAKPLTQSELFACRTDSIEWIKKNIPLDSCVNEKMLFHGTDSNVVELIRSQGMDNRISSSKNRFGAGIYFSSYTSKADQYCNANSEGLYPMFLCRVALGRKVFTAHEPMTELRRPPNVPNPKYLGEIYDSVKGRASERSPYTEYVVYDTSQCLPVYLILYSRQLCS